MNQKKIPWLFALATLSLSCSTEIDLEAPAADIPVVYGLISKQDTAHYLRIEKAFRTDGADAAAIAQNTAALYYDNLLVRLEKQPGGQSFEMVRVDGNREGYPRQEGPFAKAPNYLYKIPARAINLRGGERLLLRIDRGNGMPVVTATTEVLGDLSPREISPPNPVSMGYDRQVAFGWSAPPAATVFDLRLIVRYRENSVQSPNTFVPKMAEWTVSKEILRDDPAAERITYQIEGIAFYRFLAAAITPNPALRRIFDGLDIVITGGGREFYEYLKVARANTGLTSSQLTPFYSNLSEGRGIFASRTSAVRTGLQLSSESMDSLRRGSITKNLNFQ
jgi:hypothetical protein